MKYQESCKVKHKSRTWLFVWPCCLNWIHLHCLSVFLFGTYWSVSRLIKAFFLTFQVVVYWRLKESAACCNVFISSHFVLFSWPSSDSFDLILLMGMVIVIKMMTMMMMMMDVQKHDNLNERTEPCQSLVPGPPRRSWGEKSTKLAIISSDYY